MKFLVFGDVVGKPGREAVTEVLSSLREENDVDSVIVNIENMAHGMGISPATVEEAMMWEADVFTTGDHAWDNAAGSPLLDSEKYPIIRPANYPDGVAGRGYHIFNNGIWSVAVINLQGQVFFKNDPENPFLYIDELLKQEDIKKADVVLVDFHSEATSEVRAMGWHLDGRVTAMWGTHTHVPTADVQVMPKGMGYISDVGMNGSYHSIIGGSRSMLKGFTTQLKAKYVIEETGPTEVNAVLIEVDPKTGLTTKINHIRKILHDD